MRMPDVNDLIKRGDALEIVKRTNGDYVTAWSNIAALDAIDPESLRLTAHWEGFQADGEDDRFEFTLNAINICSKCEHISIQKSKYCPYCGAKMEG